MAAGMYGAVIIDPPDLEPVDHEYVMVQNETYLTDTGQTAADGNKLAEVSSDGIAAGTPSLTMFNGHATQYVNQLWRRNRRARAHLAAGCGTVEGHEFPRGRLAI